MDFDLFSMLSNLGGLILKVFTYFTRQSEIMEGEQKQQLSDLKEAVKDDERANEISSASNSLSPRELGQRLRKQQADLKRMLMDQTDNAEQ